MPILVDYLKKLTCLKLEMISKLLSEACLHNLVRTPLSSIVEITKVATPCSRRPKTIIKLRIVDSFMIVFSCDLLAMYYRT